LKERGNRIDMIFAAVNALRQKVPGIFQWNFPGQQCAFAGVTSRIE